LVVLNLHKGVLPHDQVKIWTCIIVSLCICILVLSPLKLVCCPLSETRAHPPASTPPIMNGNTLRSSGWIVACQDSDPMDIICVVCIIGMYLTMISTPASANNSISLENLLYIDRSGVQLFLSYCFSSRAVLYTDDDDARSIMIHTYIQNGKLLIT
jgi:hypothetical protein